MKSRFVVLAIALMGMISFTSCSGESEGEQQASDLASEINGAVENRDFSTKDEIDLDQNFDYNDDDSKDYLITIETPHGEIQLVLYDETLRHKKNFVKLASLGYYDGMAFHRVINEFMIQGGDPNTKGGDESSYGSGGPGYTIPSEIKSKFIHKKGVISAARLGDNVNPKKESSGSQFYIVHGKKISSEELLAQNSYQKENARFEGIKTLLNKPENKKDLEKIIASQQNGEQKTFDSILEVYTPEADKMIVGTFAEYTPEQIKIYEEIGGAPHLDMNYTAYGEVVNGLEVVDKLASVSVHGPQHSTPDERLEMRIKVELLKKRKITKSTGYQYN